MQTTEEERALKPTSSSSTSLLLKNRRKNARQMSYIPRGSGAAKAKSQSRKSSVEESIFKFLDNEKDAQSLKEDLVQSALNNKQQESTSDSSNNRLGSVTEMKTGRKKTVEKKKKRKGRKSDVSNFSTKSTPFAYSTAPPTSAVSTVDTDAAPSMEVAVAATATPPAPPFYTISDSPKSPNPNLKKKSRRDERKKVLAIPAAAAAAAAASRAAAANKQEASSCTQEEVLLVDVGVNELQRERLKTARKQLDLSLHLDKSLVSQVSLPSPIMRLSLEHHNREEQHGADDLKERKQAIKRLSGVSLTSEEAAEQKKKKERPLQLLPPKMKKVFCKTQADDGWIQKKSPQKGVVGLAKLQKNTQADDGWIQKKSPQKQKGVVYQEKMQQGDGVGSLRAHFSYKKKPQKTTESPLPAENRDEKRRSAREELVGISFKLVERRTSSDSIRPPKEVFEQEDVARMEKLDNSTKEDDGDASIDILAPTGKDDDEVESITILANEKNDKDQMVVDKEDSQMSLGYAVGAMRVSKHQTEKKSTAMKASHHSFTDFLQASMHSERQEEAALKEKHEATMAVYEVRSQMPSIVADESIPETRSATSQRATLQETIPKPHSGGGSKEDAMTFALSQESSVVSDRKPQQELFSQDTFRSLSASDRIEAQEQVVSQEPLPSSARRRSSSRMHPKTDLTGFLSHLAVLNDLNDLVAAPPLDTTNNKSTPPLTSLNNNTYAQHPRSRFQRMFQVKCWLLKAIDATSKEESATQKQALLQQYDLDREDLEFILEHIQLCQEGKTVIRWDLVETMVFPDSAPADVVERSVAGDTYATSHTRNLGSVLARSRHKYNEKSYQTSMAAEDSGFSTSFHDSTIGDLGRKSFDTDDCKSMAESTCEDQESVVLREEYQEVILELYEMAEESMGELSAADGQMRRRILVQLLQATSEDEAHLTGLTLDDVSEIVHHVRICQETDTSVQWDMVRDIVFPGVEDLSVKAPTPPNEGHDSFVLDPEKEALINDLGNDEQANQDFKTYFAMTQDELNIVLDHINMCKDTEEPIRWDLLSEILFPADPLRQAMLSNSCSDLQLSFSSIWQEDDDDDIEEDLKAPESPPKAKTGSKKNAMVEEMEGAAKQRARAILSLSSHDLILSQHSVDILSGSDDDYYDECSFEGDSMEVELVY
jgi:hypothetical protein